MNEILGWLAAITGLLLIGWGLFELIYATWVIEEDDSKKGGDGYY